MKLIENKEITYTTFITNIITQSEYQIINQNHHLLLLFCT